MSYTSNIGGKLIINAKGSVKIYAKENIELNSAKTITLTGVKKGVTFGKPKMIPIYVNDKCLVSFRPKDNWNGDNYGFDWVRTGDTKIKGDIYYKNITGKYGSIYGSQPGAVLTQSNAEFKKLMSKFNPHTFFIKDKTGKKKAVTYCVPWLCLYPQNITKLVKQKDGTTKATEVASGYKNITAVLRTIVKIDKKPEKLELDYDKNLFKITNPAIPPAIGTHQIEMTITCLKEFNKDQSIKVVATYKNVKGVLEKSLAGKLNVLKNKDRYKVPVVFINVITDIGNGVKKAKPLGRDKELKKYLNQGLVNPHFENTLTLDLSVNIDAKTKVKHNNKLRFNAIADIGNDPYNPKTKQINDGTIDDIYLFLNKELYKKYGKKKYDDIFKVYFINESNPQVSGIGRSMDDDKTTPTINEGKIKTVLVYDSGFTDSTVDHEVLHSMGLYHSFDNDGDFTFEIYKTDNIMDYSDIGTPAIPVISLYHWQWSKIWKKSVKE